MIDSDLEFLKYCSNEDLKILVDYITIDTDGEKRFTQILTNSDSYKKNYPNNIVAFLDDVVKELLKFGGNSFANFFRGHGVPYKELLCDVCDKMEVNYNKEAPVEVIENNFLQFMLLKSLEDMSEADMQELIKSANINTTDLTKQSMTVALQAAILQARSGSYKAATIVANAIANAVLGNGISYAASTGFTRAMSIFNGPISWVISAAWTTYDIAGPAYRVTIPAVAQICYMRRKLQQ